VSSNPATFLQRHLAGIPSRFDVDCGVASNRVDVHLVVVDRLVDVLLWQDMQTHVRPPMVGPDCGTGQDVSLNNGFEDYPVTGRNQLHEEFLRCQVNTPEHPLWHGMTVDVVWKNQNLVDGDGVSLAADWPRLVE